ncbi:unnamed protein product [Darwinula stevensoni]|uniref:Poly [ADP-ribose] polymerase n=1 Tax=Darwinula stevensoni TaxID=69355 RepID=A0A7R9A853_9CRUS|nr:unnamed protein product [Darwinula stevensoni]CAG0895513.1 unnamed protein product [Darwinula stevensoni]
MIRGRPKIKRLLRQIESDPWAVDFLLSVFIAAALSYRNVVVLHPIPLSFLEEEATSRGPVRKADFSRLVGLVNRIPTVPELMSLLRRSLTDTRLTPEEEEILTVLEEVFEFFHFTTSTCTKSAFPKIKELTAQTIETTEPNYVFEMIWEEEEEVRWQQLKGDRNTHFAYHGTRVDNIYSILLNGLQQHRSRNGAYGEGTYLSSELSVSLLYSPHGMSWDKSLLGSSISCVAVCEVIDHPGVHQMSKPRKDQRSSHTCEFPQLPEKYLLVCNNELLRLRYILVYSHQSPKNPRATETMWRAFLKRHKFLLLMTLYMVLLVQKCHFVGIVDGISVRKQHQHKLSLTLEKRKKSYSHIQ